MILEDRSGNSDPTFLTENLGKFLAACKKRPEIAAAIPSYLPDVPQLYVDVDRAKVPLGEALRYLVEGRPFGRVVLTI